MNASRRRLNGSTGAAGFDTFYETIYESRWPELRRALLLPPTRVPIPALLTAPYLVDESSLLPVRALLAAGGERLLDLCAAPGGKSLAIASGMAATAGLTANERSSARRARMIQVFANHLPDDLRRRVRVTSHDGTRFGVYEPAAYDAVLADVPCSSERHVLAAEAATAQWSPARARRLAIQAFAFACAAFDALVPGGTLVYSTCSINPAENQAVMARLVERRGAIEVPVAETVLPSERCAFGHQVLPDRAFGRGPLFLCRLTKPVCAADPA